MKQGLCGQPLASLPVVGGVIECHGHGLVGMSMSARKRAARRDPPERFCVDCRTQLRDTDLVEPDPERAKMFIDEDCLACPHCGGETDSYYPDEIPEATKRYYRIGQRLRPCPGCCACRPELRLTIRATAMSPWGWPCPVRDMFKQVSLADGTPCRLIYERGLSKPGSGQAKVAFGSPSGGMRRVWIEWQYLSTAQTRICDGSGVIALPRRAR